MLLKVCVSFLQKGLLNHLRLSIISTTKMADQEDVKETHEKTVNLETLWRWNKNKLF